jgi:hypothetical protein
VKEKGNKDKR